MNAEEERLYTQYYYNAVVEFIYFIFLYLETFKTVSLINLIKYVKLFKSEVSNLISSFEGKSSEDKLYQMLNTLECFVLVDGKVKINEQIDLKNDFYEDLILSKCVDLVLKGSNNIDDICKNLNHNNVIFISKQNLLNTLDKYSYISVNNDKTVTLHHLHGLLGFEDYVCNSVISYFREILYHCKILSVIEIESHSKSLKFCGTHNMMIIFSILNCSNQFACENGYVYLSGKSTKHPKKQPISVDLMAEKFLPRSLPVGQVVYSVYGSSLHKWSGEIGSLNRNLGNIYCVVDFTNGHQGVFNISFSTASLKVISEMDNLKNYLSVRDVVEFDAEYYSGKTLDRCWKATRVELLCNSRFEYDEALCQKLNSDSVLHRNKCMKCYSNMNFMDSYSLKVKNPECNESQCPESIKVNYESYSLSDSLNKSSETTDNNAIETECDTYSQGITNSLHVIVPNLLILDYAFVFGYVHMLMEDKAVAIAKHENKKFKNILFMKYSACPPDKSQNAIVKGQKVLALIPYIKELDSFPVASFVYGLNDEETNETDNSNVLPEEFADKIIFQNTVNNLANNKVCACHNIIKNTSTVEKLKNDLKVRMEVTELYNFIRSHYKISFHNDNYLLQFLHAISKAKSGNFCFSNNVFHSIVKMSKYLTKNVVQKEHTLKCKNKVSLESEFSSQARSQLQEICTNASTKILSDTSDTNLKSKSRSLDLGEASSSKSSSTSSFATCSSHSTESFFSCAGKSNLTKCASSCSLNRYSPIVSSTNEELSEDMRTDAESQQIKAFPAIIYEDLPRQSSHCVKAQTKSLSKNLKGSNYRKYLGLRSIPHLKCATKKRKMVSPFVSECLCKNCFKSVCNSKACVSMITESFFFFTTSINGHNVLLPMPKQNVPENLHESMKLNSCCEIVVIPSILVNLSHIVSVKITELNQK